MTTATEVKIVSAEATALAVEAIDRIDALDISDDEYRAITAPIYALLKLAAGSRSGNVIGG